jgi:protease-4
LAKPKKDAKDGIDEVPALKAVWSYGHGSTKVARIGIRGVLMEDAPAGFFVMPGPVHAALTRIRAATEDPEIEAIILEVDSPGGGITACDLIYKALIDFKERYPKRKIVALLGDVAASGGYYVAAAADYIIAHPTTLTGSIGVLLSSLNVKELGEKIGVKLVTIKSGENKDILSPFGTLTEAQREVLQKLIDEMHDRFVMLVAKGRPDLSKDEVRLLADGRIFTGAKALEYKLVDEIGYWNNAVAKTCELLGVEDVRVLRYTEEFSLSSFLRGIQPVKLSSRSLVEQTQARMMYIWQIL